MRRTRRRRGDSKEEWHMKNRHLDTRTLTGAALLTAVVVVLQLLGSFIRFGPFSISLVLVPIVVGAALYGCWVGCWLGFVFGIVVVLQPDTGFFMNYSPLTTVLICLLKGALAGLCSGLVYKALSRFDIQILLMAKGKEKWGAELAVIAAGIVCPVVNSGIFFLGCVLFFIPLIESTLAAPGEGVKFVLLGMIGGNFLFEVLFNLILSPVIVRLIRIGSSKIRK